MFKRFRRSLKVKCEGDSVSPDDFEDSLQLLLNLGVLAALVLSFVVGGELVRVSPFYMLGRTNNIFFSCSLCQHPDGGNELW